MKTTPKRSFAGRILLLVVMGILVTLLWAGSRPLPALAAQEVLPAGHDLLLMTLSQDLTPTPDAMMLDLEPTSTLLPPEYYVTEPMTTGIILGGIVLVVIVILAVLIFLRRKD